MRKAQQGDTVLVNYTGKLQDGTIFDTSIDRRPLRFSLGKGMLIAGFERAVLGMNEGEKKTVVIPFAEAYGARREESVVTMDRAHLPSGLDPRVGQRLDLTQEDDRTVLVTVTAVSKDSITVDANHPLAGKDLTFEIELVSIESDRETVTT